MGCQLLLLADSAAVQSSWTPLCRKKINMFRCVGTHCCI